MKKNFLYAMMSAIALSGAVSFSACSSSEDVMDNPDYNPADNTVKTQFSLSISKGVTNVTRQKTDIVQSTTSSPYTLGRSGFRGMENIYLIPFGETPTGTGTSLGSLIGLTAINGKSLTSGSDFDNTNNNAVVYTNITVPTTTSHFLFYGQAPEASSSTKSQNGDLTVTGLSSYVNPNGITFTPVQIYDDTKTTEKGVGTSVIALLNSLLTATDGGTGTPAKNWKDYTDNTLLKNLYEKYITLTTASSYSVAAMLVDLYASLEGLAGTATGTEGDAKAMAANLRAAILAGFTTSVDEANFKYPDYPRNLGMPDGAARISHASASDQFSLTADNVSPTTAITVTQYSDYVYPANLQYFVSSDIVTSNQQQSSTTAFDGATSWNGASGITSLYKSGSVVTPTTKSIALVKEIQYGVGNLYLIVNALSASKYYDRNGEEIDVTKSATSTDPNQGLVLTGVLIGGQGQVQWNFKPTAMGNMTIYDNVINSDALSSSVSANNFTLALETPAATDNTNGVVNIALELQNNTGKDFMGADGIIPAGGRFYLAGALNPWDNDSHNATNPTATAVTDVLSVFKQDYQTKAEITIAGGTPKDNNGDGIYDEATGGFANATNCVPDLRTPQSEVCFSVDLTWNPGIVFTVTF